MLEFSIDNKFHARDFNHIYLSTGATYTDIYCLHKNTVCNRYNRDHWSVMRIREWNNPCGELKCQATLTVLGLIVNGSNPSVTMHIPQDRVNLERCTDYRLRGRRSKIWKGVLPRLLRRGEWHSVGSRSFGCAPLCKYHCEMLEKTKIILLVGSYSRGCTLKLAGAAV
jgi:hypothetical protein